MKGEIMIVQNKNIDFLNFCKEEKEKVQNKRHRPL